MLGAVKLLSNVYSTPAAEEEDYNVMYSIDGVHQTFNIRSSLPYFSLDVIFFNNRTAHPVHCTLYPVPCNLTLYTVKLQKIETS